MKIAKLTPSGGKWPVEAGRGGVMQTVKSEKFDYIEDAEEILDHLTSSGHKIITFQIVSLGNSSYNFCIVIVYELMESTAVGPEVGGVE